MAIPQSSCLTTESIRTGWANALRHLGYKVSILQAGKSPLDFWYEERPYLVVLRTSELNRAITKAIIKYGTKVILFLDTQDSDVLLTKQLLDAKACIYPFVFWQDSLVNPWQKWLEFGLIPQQTTPGADTIRYKQGKCCPELQCDLSYIGTWRPEKAWLLKSLEQRYEQGEAVRIYGYGDWSHFLHVGSIDSDEDYMNVVASSKSNFLNFKENNNNDKLWKIKLGGGLMSAQENSYVNRVTEMLKCVNLV